KEKVQEEQITSIQKALVLNSIPNGKPLKYGRISSGYGYRTHPITQRESFHPALDFTAKNGTPVYAPASGVVVFAKRKGAYGNFLLLDHSFGFKTAYGHLSRFAVKSGDFVSKGDLIAYVGSTGRSTGPHLHYEIRYLDKWLNPKPFTQWNLENINDISAKITQVDWDSILKQAQNIITLTTEK
ncbi:MAG: M23 family metallopeptidase, partial [Sulfurovum sp.]|nr:M23 family metallopeptidase [Sulfurovum sp.]